MQRKKKLIYKSTWKEKCVWPLYGCLPVWNVIEIKIKQGASNVKDDGVI